MTISSNEHVSNEMVAAFVKELLGQRCSNYGYDYKDFRRISSQRSRARKALVKFVNENGLKAVFQIIRDIDRVSLADTLVLENEKMPRIEKRISYITCQSQNEEITNLMRTIAYGSNVKWLS